jgi:hypothetical protein
MLTKTKPKLKLKDITTTPPPTTTTQNNKLSTYKTTFNEAL